jgi:hypothetical protein
VLDSRLIDSFKTDAELLDWLTSRVSDPEVTDVYPEAVAYARAVAMLVPPTLALTALSPGDAFIILTLAVELPHPVAAMVAMHKIPALSESIVHLAFIKFLYP